MDRAALDGMWLGILLGLGMLGIPIMMLTMGWDALIIIVIIVMIVLVFFQKAAEYLKD